MAVHRLPPRKRPWILGLRASRFPRGKARSVPHVRIPGLSHDGGIIQSRSSSTSAQTRRALRPPIAIIAEFALQPVWQPIDDYLALAGMPPRSTPVAAERALAWLDAAAREREHQQAEERAAYQRWLDEQRAKQARAPAAKPKWGTPEAKRQAIERLRQKIEQRNRGG